MTRRTWASGTATVGNAASRPGKTIMRYESGRKRRGPIVTAATLLCGYLTALAADATEPAVIALTQVGCQFLESENGVDHGFQTAEAADCEAINGRTGSDRLKTAKVIRLKPGRYVFRVTNRNVPYPLGFWLRGDGVLNRARLPSVSGGGITPGVTRSYQLILKPGKYIYSCPLNPTPDYKLIVSG